MCGARICMTKCSPSVFATITENEEWTHLNALFNVVTFRLHSSVLCIHLVFFLSLFISIPTKCNANTYYIYTTFYVNIRLNDASEVYDLWHLTHEFWDAHEVHCIKNNEQRDNYNIWLYMYTTCAKELAEFQFQTHYTIATYILLWLHCTNRKYIALFSYSKILNELFVLQQVFSQKLSTILCFLTHIILRKCYFSSLFLFKIWINTGFKISEHDLINLAYF